MTSIPQPQDDESRPLLITPRETENARSLPPLISTAFGSRQLNLFQTFLANTDKQRDQLSNAIDLWDSVPRYSVSRQEMTKSRVSDKFLEPRRAAFQHRGQSYLCVIAPAYVTDLDGKDRYFYPSASEELVEDALRKLAVEQQGGFFDKTHNRSGVVFTLHALRREMSKRDHTRSYQQIVQSLNILSHSAIDIIPETKGESRLTSNYLRSLAAVSRTDLNTDPEAKWAVEFHPLVTLAIDQVTHRQYNYGLMMSHPTQLARWLHKQLILKFTFADQFRPFHMRYSTIRRDSGLLNAYSRDRAAIQMLEAAFRELKEKAVVRDVTRSDEVGPRKKLLDVIFTVHSSPEFIRETKAANKRQSQSQGRIAQPSRER